MDGTTCFWNGRWGSDDDAAGSVPPTPARQLATNESTCGDGFGTNV
jgi:hypothetical protein